jgi:Zn-finger nucleic acid-binding protein
MNCPKDGTPLEHKTYGALVDVEGCPACRGMWVPGDELDVLQDSMSGDYGEALRHLPDATQADIEMARNERAPLLSCPGCSGQLDRRDHRDCSRVRVDVCPRCRGLWLGRGEMRALEAFFEESSVSAEELRRGFFSGLLALMGSDE